jgi:hypothetical protein
MHSIVLLALFQSAGVVQEVPEVRKQVAPLLQQLAASAAVGKLNTSTVISAARFRAEDRV